MTISFWQSSERAPELRFDVAVVGGGIIGCSTAFWLSRLQPSLRIAIVEAGMLASGASGRNAGFLLQGTSDDYMTACARYGQDRTRRLWQFTKENRELIFSELDRQAFLLEAGGSLSVAGDEAEDARFQEAVALLRADGAPVAYLPEEEVNRKLKGQGFYGGLYVSSGAILHPVKLVRHIAEQSGAELLEHHRVVELSSTQGGVVLETPQRRIVAGQAILALNAYLPQLLPTLESYVRPVRAQMLATDPMRSRWLTMPVYSHEGYYYIRQAPDGAILLGGARHLHKDAEKGYEDTTTPALQSDLERYLFYHFPQTRRLAVRQRWSGTMGFSPDRLPSIGQVPEVPGSFWAAGFTGHGMGYGFRFGRLMAEVLLDHTRPEGLDLFTADRFNKKKREGLR